MSTALQSADSALKFLIEQQRGTQRVRRQLHAADAYREKKGRLSGRRRRPIGPPIGKEARAPRGAYREGASAYRKGNPTDGGKLSERRAAVSAAAIATHGHYLGV